MSAELRELYQTVIRDHSKQPRNRRQLGRNARRADGYSPLCGDSITVYVNLADDVLCEVAFQGVGCAISTASASLMTEALRGKSAPEAERLCEAFREMVSSGVPVPVDDELGALVPFARVHSFPSRVKCALLPWSTFRAALLQGPSE